MAGHALRISPLSSKVFVFLLFTGLGGNFLPAQLTEPASVFKPAVAQIQSRTHVPILLPSKLPSAAPERDIKAATGEATEEEYFISLYYSEDRNASYAAGFGGSKRIFGPRDLPNTRRVILSGGRAGRFRPVSCGGSCGPANLWWEQDGAMYQIQIKLGSDLAERDQEKILVETANSVVAVRR
jgi:hypothetical protein